MCLYSTKMIWWNLQFALPTRKVMSHVHCATTHGAHPGTPTEATLEIWFSTSHVDFKKNWPQLLSASFHLLFWWTGETATASSRPRIWWHCPSTWAFLQLLSTTTTSQFSDGDEDLRLSAVVYPQGKQLQIWNRTPLLKVPKLPIAGWHQKIGESTKTARVPKTLNLVLPLLATKSWRVCVCVWVCVCVVCDCVCVCWLSLFLKPTLSWRKNLK